MASSIYKFNINNLEYINALCNTVGDLAIERIEPPIEGLPENTTIKALPALIEQLKAHYQDDIEIKVLTKNIYPPTQSLMNVFPAFQAQSIPMEKAYEEVVDEISNFIGFYTNKFIDLFSDEEPYRAINKLKFLTKEQAWKALHLAHQKTPFLTAIDLPLSNAILGLTACGNNTFIINYVDKAFNIRLANDLFFDIDDGFLDKNRNPEYVYVVPQDLVKAFETWRDNGRKGPVLEAAAIDLTLADRLGMPALQKPSQKLAFPTHKHSNKILNGYYLETFAITLAGILAIAGASGFALGALIVGFVGLKTVKLYIEGNACEFTDNIVPNTTTYKRNLEGEEKTAFDAGVDASHSCQGFLNAWQVKETYTHYTAYCAGKHLAENDNQEVISKISSLSR